MKVLLALHQFPPYGNGGTEQLAGWSARALSRAGHPVRIVAAIPRRSRVGAQASDRRGGDLDGVFVEPSNDGAAGSRIRSEYADPPMGTAFGRVLDGFRPDVVHFFHLGGLTTCALDESVVRGIPTVLMVTDFWFECPTIQMLLADSSICPGPSASRLNCARHLLQLRHPALRGIERVGVLDPFIERGFEAAASVPRLSAIARPYVELRGRSATVLAAMRKASRILAPTEHMRQRLLGFGLTSDAISLLRYGVPSGEAASRRGSDARRDDTFRIAFVGTLASHKGAHLIVDALRQIADRRVRLELYGGGGPPQYRDELQRTIGDDSRIVLRGDIEPEAIDELLCQVDVLVIPSLWYENAPLIALQAVANRCPVLAADVPGMRECVHEPADGWFFRRGDADHLAARIRLAIDSPERRLAIRQATARTRSTDDFAADLVSVYRSCTDHHGVFA
jgi:glycosyltransferase involved in cell wall biosynthesis